MPGGAALFSVRLWFPRPVVVFSVNAFAVGDVNLLVRDVSPIERAEKVLGFLGVDPYQYGAWVDFIGVDLSQIPMIGTAGEWAA